MRLRLLALIALVLGLSRLAFPAELTPVKPNGARLATRGVTHKKARTRPVRRYLTVPRSELSAPLIAAPELQIAAVQSSSLPAGMRAQMPSKIIAAAAAPRRDLSRAYWSANEVRPSGNSWSAKVTATPAVTWAGIGGDPRLDFRHHQSTFGLTIRL